MSPKIKLLLHVLHCTRSKFKCNWTSKINVVTAITFVCMSHLVCDPISMFCWRLQVQKISAIYLLLLFARQSILMNFEGRKIEQSWSCCLWTNSRSILLYTSPTSTHRQSLCQCLANCGQCYLIRKRIQILFCSVACPYMSVDWCILCRWWDGWLAYRDRL